MIFAKFGRASLQKDWSGISMSTRESLKVRGSVLTRILVIVLIALLVVGLIALALSVFTVH